MSILDSREKPSILVVDDTPDNLMLINNRLRKDYRLQVAISGEKALQIALSTSPLDLILLDGMMPVMDGYAVRQTLRKKFLTAHIPIIFLTAKSEVEDERRGLDLGTFSYIIKPISPPILEALIRIHLTAKASADFLAKQALGDDTMATKTG